MAQNRVNNNIRIEERLAGKKPAVVMGFVCGYFGWFEEASGVCANINCTIS